MLFINPKLKSKTNNFLALTVLTLCFSNLQYLLYDFGIIGDFYVKYLFIPFEFLILPMFYLFVRGYLNKFIKQKTTYLFFSLFTSIFLIQSFTSLFKLNKNLISLFLEYFAVGLTLLLIGLTLKMIIRYEKLTKSNESIIPKTTSWLKQLLIVGIILCVVWFVSLNVFKEYLGGGLYPFYPLWIGISILLYWIAYTSIFQTNIYNDRKNIREKIINVKRSSSISNNSNLSKFQEIKDLIIKEKLYLNPKMNLTFLSNKFKISESYLSQLINHNLDKNYNDFINELRVEYVKELLKNKDYSKYTITALGLESGFNSKTNFYSVFKKHTGKTPNQYKKLVQNY